MVPREWMEWQRRRAKARGFIFEATPVSHRRIRLCFLVLSIVIYVVVITLYASIYIFDYSYAIFDRLELFL